MILHALAFIDRGPENYRGDWRGFFNEELETLNRDAELREVLERRMMNALARAKAVFGNHAFHRPKPSGIGWMPTLNTALVEVVLTGFDRYFPEHKPLSPDQAARIQERLLHLCSMKPFLDAILIAVSSRQAVSTRFSLWMKELADVA